MTWQVAVCGPADCTVQERHHADRIGELVEDSAARTALADRGLDAVRSVAWDAQIDKVWRAMTKQEDTFNVTSDTAG